jgi:AcrR family transcriptional regulator
VPPKQKITKNMVLKAGFDIARRDGIESVNSRSIAEALSCSTQPIFSCFATMEELRKGVFDFACDKCVDEILEHENSPDLLNLSTKWYINLMRNEPHLYKLLYFSNGFSQGSFHGLISNYTSNQVIISKLRNMYDLEAPIGEDILLRVFALLHGIGALITFNNLEMDDAEIANMVKRTAADMTRCAKAEDRSIRQ